MKKKMPWEQLARYFAGELTEEEDREMEFWIKAHPERKKQIDRLYEVWKKSAVPPHSLNVEEAWSRLSGNMDQHDLEVEHSNHVSYGVQDIHTSYEKNQTIRKYDNRAQRLAMTAAAVVLILTTGFFTSQFNTENQHEAVEEISHREIVTHDGEWATYVLVDGTKVMLHANSRLNISGNYNEENREVYLEGEAYFEVSHDPQKPFIVLSEKAYTEVLGTSFLVQAWPDSFQEVEVVVAEGKVALGDILMLGSNDKNEAIITRNQKGVLTENQGPVVTDIDDLDWHLGWTEQRLVFDNRPLNEIVRKLERWYVVDIIIEDESIAERKLTAEIDYSQSMNEVVTGIAMSLDLEIEKNNRTITFRSKEKDNS